MSKGPTPQRSELRFGREDGRTEACNSLGNRKRLDWAGRDLALHPEIEAAVLYGSRARGTHRYGSDIDVCMFGPEVTWDTRVRVLSEYWDDMWPWRLDFKHWETATSPRFREEIRRDAQLIYDREGSTALPVALR